MPWLETSSVKERERFIADERRGLYDGIWSIYFGTVLLAKVDERDLIIRD